MSMENNVESMPIQVYGGFTTFSDMNIYIEQLTGNIWNSTQADFVCHKFQ